MKNQMMVDAISDVARFCCSPDKRIFFAPLTNGGKSNEEPPVDVKAMHAKIGELTLQNDFLEGALIKAGMLSAKR